MVWLPESKTIEKCGEVDCWGRLGSGNCFCSLTPLNCIQCLLQCIVVYSTSQWQQLEANNICYTPYTLNHRPNFNCIHHNDSIWKLLRHFCLNSQINLSNSLPPVDSRDCLPGSFLYIVHSTCTLWLYSPQEGLKADMIFKSLLFDNGQKLSHKGHLGLQDPSSKILCLKMR